ncbi:Endonuclease, Uma2 family (restriction endonuclease fold) [Dyadobacter soli]|uniref:Endonuclease, Uma2 family (Restriction endonuclease fold) n=2 Tax=Dyadobacter soli TaxID=659014 RepID=A0A1G7ERH1_9BACT|nr:Endonuclease, Uma2 family (restriction endonuclease fold) [Dyadobacter soli]
MSNRIVSEIMNVPDAYLVLDAVQKALDQERERRLKFYNDITEQEKIEFINGEIVVHSPVKKKHAIASGLLYRIMSIYVDREEIGFVGYDNVMIALTRNDYEPDVCFFKNPRAETLSNDHTIFPAPDLVVEILSPSTRSRDRGLKFEDYQAHGIEEYWIIDPETEILEQYHLVDKKYELILTSGTQNVRSFVIDGFQIPIRCIFDKVENLKAIQNL